MKACADDELLEKYHEGLICLTGCLGGRLAKSIVTEDHRQAEAWIRQLRRIFGDDLFCELMPHAIPEQQVANIETARIAERHGIGVVATLDEHYPTAEWAPTQDVLLMIATNQTVKKREKRREEGEDVYEFSIKTLYHQTEKQIRSEFVKNHPDLSQQVVDESLRNTLVVAGMCKPFLVDKTEKMPTVSFPGVEDNEAYLRRLVYEGLARRGYADEREYKDRIEYELSVISRLDSVDQILMAWDVVDWAKSDRPVPKRDKKTGELVYEGRKEPMMVGPGRGCLTGDVDIWTTEGFKELREIVPGDQVLTHTGAVAPVRKVFTYDVDEELVTVKSYLGDSRGVTMTSDQKVLVEKAVLVTNKSRLAQGYRYEKPSGMVNWIPSDDIEVGDLICMPGSNDLDYSVRTIDLARYVNDIDLVEDEWIVERKPTNKPYLSSMNDINKKYGIDTRRLKNHATGIQVYPDISNVLSLEGFHDDESWQDYIRANRYNCTRIKRFIVVDEQFSELLGFWASNGWLRSDSDTLVGWAERRSTSNGSASQLIGQVTGITPRDIPHAKSDLLQLEIRSRCWARLIDSLVDGYDRTAQTKSLPNEIVFGCRKNREGVLRGLWRGDGSIIERNSYTTSSPKLMHQVRTLLWSVGIGNGVRIDDREDSREEFKNRSRSWKIIANRRWQDDTPNQTGSCRRGNALMTRVRDVTREHTRTKVYDLEIAHEDTSYTTSSFVVHNSAAASTVCWAIGLTNLNPIKHRLLFERFLNPDRVGKPDVDTDLSPDDVDDVERYVKARYGPDRVLDVIAHSTFGPRAAINDVARVLDIPQAHFRAATKTIDDNEKGRLAEIRLLNPAVDRFATDYPEAWEIACLIQGSVARKSEHAGALLVLPVAAEECGIPVERKGGQKGKCLTAFGERAGKGNMLLSEYGYIGKLDLLRVAELSKQKKAVDLIRESTGETIDLDALSVHDDPLSCDVKVMEIFAAGLLVGVFQLSATAQKLCRQVNPTSILDLSSVNALVRPGPRGAGYDQTYARRKRGEEEVSYWHPMLESCLDYTYGVMAFQENIMEVVHRLGGLTLGQADVFRKIASKLYREPAYAKEVMGEWFEPVRAGFMANGISADEFGQPTGGGLNGDKPTGMWADFLSLSNYSFPLPHSSGYMVLAYRDAWLKTYYPREFYAALLSCGLSQITKKRSIQKLEAVREARHMGLSVLPPDVNESGRDWTVVEGGIRLGLESIRHIGPAACAALEEHRPFTSMQDVERRVPARALNVTGRAALVMSGACDRWNMRDDFTEVHIDACERDLLGMSLTSVHSIASYADAIDGRFWTEDEFDEASDGTRVAVVGEVTGIKEHVDSRGGLMAFVDLAYGPDHFSCTFFASLYAEYKDLIDSRRPLLITGVKNTYNGRSSVRVESLPTTDDSTWMAPVLDLGAYVDMIGDEAEQLVGDSIYPEDVVESLETAPA